MTYRFVARHVGVDHGDDYIAIGFSDSEISPSASVVLVLANDFDDQDTELSMDSVYVEIEDQSRSHYGGITTISRIGNCLLFELSESAKAELNVDGNVEMILDDNHSDLDRVVLELTRMAESTGIPYRATRHRKA